MNNIKTVFFMTLMGVIFLALGYVAGGRSGMTFALVFAIGINVFSYWFSDSMVLRMYNAREVGYRIWPSATAYPFREYTLSLPTSPMPLRRGGVLPMQPLRLRKGF